MAVYTELVENREVFSAERAELNLFSTRTEASNFHLTFSAPVVATMLEGKKVMRLNGGQEFAFLPGESALLAADTVMSIDFPEASVARPTRCLALVLDPKLISDTCARLSETSPLPDGQSWMLHADDLHFSHTRGIQRALDRIVDAFMEEHAGRDVFVQHALEEVIIRMLQLRYAEARASSGDACPTQDRMAAVTRYIRAHLVEQLDVAVLSKQAYMSESHFHRTFKEAFGVTPNAYVRQERLNRAADLLARTDASVHDVSARVGFQSLAHFSRAFKAYHGVAPSRWGA